MFVSSTEADPGAISDARLAAQLTEIDNAAGRVRDLSVHFEQRKITALLKKPLISTGTVRCVGSAVRWDTQEPAPCILYADGTDLRLYYPQDKQEEVYPIDQRLGDLLSSPVPRLSVMERHFKIDAAGPNDLSSLSDESTQALRSSRDPTIALRLTPIDPALVQHVRQVVVVLDARTALALVVLTIDADGDHTEITFSAFHVNTGIQPRQIELQVPPDTAVSHPLDAAPAATSSAPSQ